MTTNVNLQWEYGDGSENDDDLFVSEIVRTPESTATYPKWEWACIRCDGAPGYGQASMFLRENYTQEIDLSAVEIGEEFGINFTMGAIANDVPQGETWARAFARDPLATSGGPSFSTQGLLPTNRGRLVLAPVPEPQTWALWGLGLAGLLAGARQRQRAERTTA